MAIRRITIKTVSRVRARARARVGDSWEIG